MANDSKDLAPILFAIGRQIAGRKGTSGRADRPERDLPILLLPASRPGQEAGERGRPARDLPYLMHAVPAEEPASAPLPTTPPEAEPVRPPRHEGAFLRLDPGLGSPA